MTKIPDEIAIALSYDPESMHAPMVARLGERHVAREILRLARRYGVPLAENQDLAVELSHLAENEQIPEALYEEIALLFRDVE